MTQGAAAALLCLVFWFTNYGALDMYYWLAVQGVIWIVLIQALTSLSVWAYFRREHPTEQHWWRTVVAPWIGFLAQLVVLYLCYDQLTALGAGTALYVEELFVIGPFEMNWLGIIGIVVPVAGLAYAYWLRAANREKYELVGRFINEGSV